MERLGQGDLTMASLAHTQGDQAGRLAEHGTRIGAIEASGASAAGKPGIFMTIVLPAVLPALVNVLLYGVLAVILLASAHNLFGIGAKP